MSNVNEILEREIMLTYFLCARNFIVINFKETNFSWKLS